MTDYKPRQESKAYCRSVWFVHEGQEEKSLLHQVIAQAAARLSGPRSADSRESLRYQNRELASLKLCSGKFTQTAASRPQLKSDMVTWSYNPSYFGG